MRVPRSVVVILVSAVVVGSSVFAVAGAPGPRPCLPDIPIPAESVGSLGLPFDVPIWPTIVKTEFHILPWVSFGKASVCIPGTCTSIEFPAPSLSLKPIPVWFPWLRPVDSEIVNEPRSLP